MVNHRTKSNQPRPLYLHRPSNSSSFLSDTINGEEHTIDVNPKGITILQPGVGIPKSRTLSVISNLTQSFSHGSIARQETSRNASGESRNQTSNHRLATQHTPSPKVQDVLTYQAPATPTLPPGQSNNIEEVSTAMPPQYWAGRFMALHDRFHSELLEPHHLTQLCEAQTAQPLADFTRPASAATQNNPSTSVFSIPRSIANQSSSSRKLNGNRLPQSATSGAILQSTSYNLQPDPPSTHGVSTLSSAHKPTTTNTSSYRRRNQQYHLPTTDENSIPEHPSTTNTTPHFTTATTTATTTTATANTGGAPSKPSSSTTTASTTITAPQKTGQLTTHLADDEESRVRRVLLRLEYMCVTDAAQLSLRQWRVGYARRSGRAEFLPDAVPDLISCCVAGFGSGVGVGGVGGGVGGGGGRVASGGVGGGGRGATAAATSGRVGTQGKVAKGVISSASEINMTAGMYGGGGTGFCGGMSVGRGGDGKLGEGGERKMSGGAPLGTNGLKSQKGEGRRMASEYLIDRAGGGNQHDGARAIVGGEHGNGHAHTHTHSHGHEFGRRGREMVRRLKRSLVGGADKLNDGGGETVGTAHGNRPSRANGEPGEGYMADLESLAIEEREKGRKGGRKFSFF